MVSNLLELDVPNQALNPAFSGYLAAWAVFLLLLVLTRWRGRIYCNTLCPVGALLGSMSLVLILMLEVHLRISSSYVEYCLSAVLILLSAAWGSVQKKKRLQPKNRIT